MGGCLSLSLNRSGEVGVPASQDENKIHLATPISSGSRGQDISGLNSGNSSVKDTDSIDNGEVSASTSARSADFPSTRCLLVSLSLVSGSNLFPSAGKRLIVFLLPSGQPSRCICVYGFTQTVTRHIVNRSSFFYSTSNYSNASAVTPTSVLPAMGSRDNHLWNHSHYVKVRKLREGSSGSVHLAVDLRYGNQVAIKFIPRGSNR